MTTPAHDDHWAEELDQLRRGYPSVVAFAHQWWNYNVPMLENLRVVVPPPASVLEVGTGTGALAVLLQAHGYRVLGVDNDERVLASAAELATYFRSDCRFERADGFDLSRYEGRFDVAFSGGVLEHFSEDEAAELIRQQARAARHVMAIVPTWHSLKNDPMSGPTHARKIWRGDLDAIFRVAGVRIVRRFGYGIPGGPAERAYRLLMPRLVQWVLENRFSYAATLGIIGASAPGLE